MAQSRPQVAKSLPQVGPTRSVSGRRVWARIISDRPLQLRSRMSTQRPRLNRVGDHSGRKRRSGASSFRLGRRNWSRSLVRALDHTSLARARRKRRDASNSANLGCGLAALEERPKRGGQMGACWPARENAARLGDHFGGRPATYWIDLGALGGLERASERAWCWRAAHPARAGA